MTEITPYDPTSLAKIDDELDIQKGSYLPNLVILHAGSPQVAEGTGQVRNYFCENDLGDELRVIVVAHRWHALLLCNHSKKKESFDKNSTVGKEIVNIVQSKQRSYPENDARYGISWLVFLPDINLFAVFHPNTWTTWPATATITSFMKPIEARPPAAKDLPLTNFFKFKIKSASNNYKTPIPDVQPLDVEGVAECAASPEKLKLAMAMFQPPAEEEIVVTDGTPER